MRQLDRKYFNTSFYIIILLVLIIVTGTIMRFWNIHKCALYMDSQDFLAPFDMQLKTHEIFTLWHNMPTGKNHLPMPVYLNTLILRTFALSPTIGNLSLPSATIGSILIVLAFLIGKIAKDDLTGLFCAILTAYNPIMISISQTAYYYIYGLLGAFINVLAWVILLRASISKFPLYYYVILLIGNFFMFYSDSSVWPYAFVSTLLAMIFILVYIGRRHLVIFIIITAVMGLPLVFISWGLPTILRETFFYSEAARQYWTSVFYGADNSFLSVLIKACIIMLSFLFGTTFWRLLLDAVIFCYFIYFVVFKKNLTNYKWLGFVFCFSLLLQIYAISKTVVPPTHARFVYLVPLLYLACSWVFSEIIAWFEKRISSGMQFIKLAFVMTVIGIYFYPSFLAATQIGRPQPYFEIAKWLDTNLPRGSVVITERFFDAFNEYRRHPATNVFVTSIVPNQTAREYLGYKFRERTQEFILRNPVSAFIQTEMLWDHPDIGPWYWPNLFYAREVVITNQAGLLLHKLGFSYVSLPWDKSMEKQYYRKILYNLPEDIIERVRRNGAIAFLLKDEGWVYVKTQDYSNWAGLFDEAKANIYLFTEYSTNLPIRIIGVIPSENPISKVISVNNEYVIRLNTNQWVNITTPPLLLLPGTNVIVFKDISLSAQFVPLLIQEMYVVHKTLHDNPYSILLP